MQMRQFDIDNNLKELTKHETTMLPIACYETTIQHHIQGYIPIHWHEELQFVYVKEGTAQFQVNDDQIEVKKGQGLFINSGCLHMAKEVGDGPCTYICINVDTRLLLSTLLHADFVQPYLQSSHYVKLLPSDDWAATILNGILTLQQLLKSQSPLYELLVCEQLLKMWRHLIVNGLSVKASVGNHQRQARMKEMLHFIHGHFSQKITLQQIATSGQLSRSECCRYFQQTMQTSPMQYVLTYRIQQSLILLQDEDYSITDIAYQVGFTSTSYYIERFKAVMNVTPLAYRKHLQYKN